MTSLLVTCCNHSNMINNISINLSWQIWRFATVDGLARGVSSSLDTGHIMHTSVVSLPGHAHVWLRTVHHGHGAEVGVGALGYMSNFGLFTVDFYFLLLCWNQGGDTLSKKTFALRKYHFSTVHSDFCDICRELIFDITKKQLTQDNWTKKQKNSSPMPAEMCQVSKRKAIN